MRGHSSPICEIGNYLLSYHTKAESFTKIIGYPIVNFALGAMSVRLNRIAPKFKYRARLHLRQALQLAQDEAQVTAESLPKYL